MVAKFLKNYFRLNGGLFLVGLLLLFGCQKEPCTAGKEQWYGVEIYQNNEITTNTIVKANGIGLTPDLPILLGKQNQYLFPLNPASDTSSYILKLQNRQDVYLKLAYFRKPILVSESCGFVFQYEKIVPNVIGVDSFKIIRDYADSTRQTNLKIWIN